MICAACGEPTPDTPCARCGADPVLAGRYRLEEPIGQGTAGITFRATRLADGVAVAIKEMPLRRADAEKTRELFAREARVLRQLQHPQIPRYHEDFVAGQGRLAAIYLVQELVEGVDLAREMDAHRYSEDEVLDVVDGLLPVLGWLHTRSPPVIHRDVKPRNVMRRPDGSLVLLDFGAVRDVLVDRALGGSTIAGTFGYMAPEQFRGEAVPATDLYGLGALAVALLTRREPHTLADATGALKWEAHARTSPPFTRLLNRMLAREVVDRPKDAAAVAEAIRAIRRGPPSRPEAPPPVPSEIPRVATIERSPRPVLQEKPPFEPPVVRAPASAVVRGEAPQPAPRVALVLGLVGATGMLGIGAIALLFTWTIADARQSGFESPKPISAPPATCTVTTRPTQGDLSDPSVSRYQFVGGTSDGHRVALALGRPSDGRGEVIVYEAGSREMVAERVAPPELITRDWTRTLATLVQRNAATLKRAGLDPAVTPTAASWCQEGTSVSIAGKPWSWQTFSEPCSLGRGENTSYALCPSGADDLSACVVPPYLDVGCWDEAPRLVDVFTLGDAVWAVAERPHGGTTPRFAAGVVVE